MIENSSLIRDELIKKAENGDVEAQHRLGIIYETAQLPVDTKYGSALELQRDDEQAVYWFRKAADQDHPGAQFSLGWRYEFGGGVDRNPEYAVHWYKKSAEHEYLKAQINLGVMYAEGLGVAQNSKQAVYWYKKAVVHDGMGDQLWLLSAISKHAEIVGLLENGEAEDATAQFNLGIIYEEGEVLAKDDEKAIFWYLRSADHGYIDAHIRLCAMYERSFGENVGYKKSVEWYKNRKNAG